MGKWRILLFNLDDFLPMIHGVLLKLKVTYTCNLSNYIINHTGFIIIFLEQLQLNFFIQLKLQARSVHQDINIHPAFHSKCFVNWNNHGSQNVACTLEKKKKKVFIQNSRLYNCQWLTQGLEYTQTLIISPYWYKAKILCKNVQSTSLVLFCVSGTHLLCLLCLSEITLSVLCSGTHGNLVHSVNCLLSVFN